MNIRPLIIDDSARAQAARVIAHAKTHPYHSGQPTPGDDPRFVAKLGTYRTVFTFTDVDGKLWRHLSISVPGDKYPHPAAAFMIADLFGFTGWDERTLERAPSDWLIDVNYQEHCVVLGQLA